MAKNNYWDENTERTAIALSQAESKKEIQNLYMQIREPVRYMIISMLGKRKYFHEWENTVCDLETFAFTIITQKPFDQKKGKMYSYLTHCVWNRISFLFKQVANPRNNLISLNASSVDDDRCMIDDLQECEIDISHVAVIQELRARLFFLVPLWFPNERDSKIITLLETAYCMIEIFADTELKKIRQFRDAVLERVPEATPRNITHIRQMMKLEYQRIRQEAA